MEREKERRGSPPLQQMPSVPNYRLSITQTLAEETLHYHHQGVSLLGKNEAWKRHVNE